MSVSRVIVFLIVVVVILGGLHLYLWFRLVRSPMLPPSWSRPITIALVLLAASLPLSFLIQREIPKPVASILLWPAFTWMGVAFLLLVVLLASELFRFGVRVPIALGWIGGPGTAWSGIRLSAAIARVAVLLTVALSILGLHSALRPPPIRRVRCEVRRWPASLAGYTIAQVSDVHLGPTIGRSFLTGVVRRVNELKPDLIVITGDLVDGTVKELESDAAPLTALRAPDGVFFITGNHEYYSGAESWVRHIRSLGITVLRGDRVALRGANGFDLAGVDDWSARSFEHDHKDEFPRAFSGRDPARPLVLLAHQPRWVREAATFGADLQISGHTHGGQIFPFHYLAALPQPFLAGLHRSGDTLLYISRGTGYWGPPMRLLAPSEITLLTLVSPTTPQ